VLVDTEEDLEQAVEWCEEGRVYYSDRYRFEIVSDPQRLIELVELAWYKNLDPYVDRVEKDIKRSGRRQKTRRR